MEVNRIYNENCLETMARMPDGFIDLTVTSPPYDNLRSYNGYTFDFEPIATELFRVTKQGGIVVWIVNDATVNGSETGTSFKHALGFKAWGFNLHDTMIWYKSDPTPQQQHPRYQPAFEYMFVLCKGNRPNTFRPLKVPNKNAGMQKITSGQRNSDNSFRHPNGKELTIRDEQFRPNVWNMGANGYYGHPASFPEQLARDHIHSWSSPGDIVYDCFMGSGTTAKAAHQLGRRWIGSEISAEYVELANKRLEPYLMQENLFQ
jgi:DNA modification methylase